MFKPIPCRIVLVQPSLPENLGAVARAMRHFGQTELVTVGGRATPDHPAAIATSAGAEALLESSRNARTLGEAIAGSALVIGTTARPWAKPDLHSEWLEEAMPDILAHGHPRQPLTWVFGTERHGLTIHEAQQCDRLVRIPGEPGTCLNLAMAANIILYSCYTASTRPTGNPLTNQEGGWLRALPENLILRAEQHLEARGFWRPGDGLSKRHTLRRLASRLRLDTHETRLLEAMLVNLFTARGESRLVTTEKQTGEIPQTGPDPA